MTTRVAGLDQVRRAAALRADLHDALVLAGGGEHRLALDHVHADRLLHVDVGPGLDGGDHRQGVPVVGRADQDDVEVLLLEHLAVVAVGPRLLLRRSAAAATSSAASASIFLSTSHSDDDLDRRDLDEAEQVALAVPAAADQADALRLVVGGGDVVAGGGEARPAAAAWRKSRRFMGTSGVRNTRSWG